MTQHAAPTSSPESARESAKALPTLSLGAGPVYLRPVTPADYAWLQSLEISNELAFRWRYRGSTPSPEQWLHTLWANVLAQFVVVTALHDQPVGLVVAYRAHFQDGHAYVAAVRFGSKERSPAMVLGFGLLVEYVFSCWDFHKLYMEAPEYNFEQFASGLDRLFTIEGHLRDHTSLGGQKWDEYILAIYRETWNSRGRPLLETVRAAALRGSAGRRPNAAGQHR